jgi:hypothetical protein
MLLLEEMPTAARSMKQITIAPIRIRLQTLGLHPE